MSDAGDAVGIGGPEPLVSIEASGFFSQDNPDGGKGEKLEELIGEEIDFLSKLAYCSNNVESGQRLVVTK